jgi:hypothetical protein
MFHTHLASEVGTTAGQLVADIVSGLNLAPPPPTKKKHHLAAAVTKFTISFISLSTAMAILPYSSALKKLLGFSNSL